MFGGFMLLDPGEFWAGLLNPGTSGARWLFIVGAPCALCSAQGVQQPGLSLLDVSSTL